MQLFNLSMTELGIVLFGIGALFALIIGIRMPSSFTNDEKVRNALKKKIYGIEKTSEPDANDHVT